MLAKNKLEQFNQAHKKAIGEILLKVFPGTLPLSVTDVLIHPSFQHGRVWLSTTPEILQVVEEKRPEIQGLLKTKLKERYTPRLTFVLDDQYLEHMDSLFNKVEDQENKN